MRGAGGGTPGVVVLIGAWSMGNLFRPGDSGGPVEEALRAKLVALSKTRRSVDVLDRPGGPVVFNVEGA